MDDFNNQNIKEGFTPNEEYQKPPELFPNISEINQVDSNIQNQGQSNYSQGPAPSYSVYSPQYQQTQPPNQQQFSQPYEYPKPNQQYQPNQSSYNPPPVCQPQPQNNPQNQYNPVTQLPNGVIYTPPPAQNITYNQGTYQQQNYVANSNNELLNNKGSPKRLRCQKILIILLFIIVPLSIACQIFGLLRIFASIDDIFIIINGIWMIIFTKKGENSRNKSLGDFSLISCIIGPIFRFSSLIKKDKDLLSLVVFFIYYIITIEIIVASYNMICCCDCNKCDN